MAAGIKTATKIMMAKANAAEQAMQRPLKQAGILDRAALEYISKAMGYKAVLGGEKTAPGLIRGQYGKGTAEIESLYPGTYRDITGWEQMADEERMANLTPEEQEALKLVRTAQARQAAIIAPGGEGFNAPEWYKEIVTKNRNQLITNLVNKYGPDAVASSLGAESLTAFQTESAKGQQDIALKELGAMEGLATGRQAGLYGSLTTRLQPMASAGDTMRKVAQDYNTMTTPYFSSMNSYLQARAPLAAAQSAKQSGGGFGATLGGIAGTVLGSFAGPIGSAVGNRIGSAIGGSVQ